MAFSAQATARPEPVIFVPVTNTASPAASRLPRRDFLRYAGATSAAAALLLTGCKDDATTTDTTPDPNAATVSLGSTTDVALLNLLQASKQITAELYKRIVAAPPAGFFTSEVDLLRNIQTHKAIHRDFLKAAVNSLRTRASDAMYSLADLTFDFSKVTLNTPAGALNALLTLENLTIRTTVGVARYVTREKLLTTFSQIMSVDARHAATLADLPSAVGASAFDPQDVAPDARNYSQLPSVTIPLLNTYLAAGSRLLIGNLA